MLPDLKRLGPRLGKKLPLVKNALAKADAAKLLAEMESAGKVSLKLDDGSSEDLDRDDLQVRLKIFVLLLVLKDPDELSFFLQMPGH